MLQKFKLVNITERDELPVRSLLPLGGNRRREHRYLSRGPFRALQVEIQERIPSAEFFETLWAWADEGAGSLLITDRRTALVSVLVNQGATDSIHEIGIWRRGEHNSLIVVLRAIFTCRLNTLTSESGELTPVSTTTSGDTQCSQFNQVPGSCSPSKKETTGAENQYTEMTLTRTGNHSPSRYR